MEMLAYVMAAIAIASSYFVGRCISRSVRRDWEAYKRARFWARKRAQKPLVM